MPDRPRLLLHLGLFALLLALVSPAARAATLTVTTTADDGSSGSLRAAIAQANTDGAGGAYDTITFAVTGTITLTTDQLTLSVPMTITGPGVAVSGNNSSRVFEVSGGTSSSPVALSGLTIEGGSAGSGNGGGVLIDSGADASLTGCALTANSAYDGGGLCNYGTLALTACALTGDSASANFGGGLCNFGTLTLTGCTLTGDSDSNGNGYGGFGGGLYNSGTATLTDDILYGDTAPSGPEVYNHRATVTASYCDIGQTGGYTDSGHNINQDPQFVQPYTDSSTPFNLHVQPGSPVVGAGVYVASDTTDITGATRADPPTIGAYEGDVANTMTTVSVNGSVGGSAAAPYNTSVPVTVTVANTSGGRATPAGTVNVDFGDGTTVGNQPLINGAVTVTHTYTRPGGPDRVYAEYTPSARDFSRSNGNVTVTVGQAMPTLVVTSGSPNNTSVYGQSVTFTATLSGAYRPGGSVTFTDSLNGGTATTLASGVPIGGGSGGLYTATYTARSPSALAAGSHSITASYNGDPNNAAATSQSITQTVTAAATTTALTANGSGTGATVTAGGSVSFRVTVADATAGSTGTPGGTVTIAYGDGASSGPLTLSRGTVTVAHTYTTASPPGSPDTATATYQPDATGDFSAGSPATVPVTVAPGTPTANGQSVTTQEGTAAGITLSGSDPDQPPLPLTYSYTQPANGTVTGTGPNVTYTPNPGYYGSDSFTFTVSNGTNVSSPATVGITVSQVATHLVVAPAGAATAGQPIGLTVTAVDAGGSTVTGYSGTATLSDTDPRANPIAAVTLTNGVGTASATFYTAGAQTVTAMSGGLTGAGQVTVNSDPNGSAKVAVTGATLASGAGGTVTATVTLLDSGTGAASNAHLTLARLGGVSASSLGAAVSLGAGQSQTVTVTFPANTPAGAQTLLLSGSYAGPGGAAGAFTASLRVTVP